MQNSPLGLRVTEVKCLFFVDFEAACRSSWSLPPWMSFRHSRKPLMFPDSVSHRKSYPLRVVVTISPLMVGWNWHATTSEECCRVSKRPCLPKMSQILTVLSHEELARREPLSD